ncbi:MAG TPA: sigma-54 dependent transcriptional regulator [Polyangiaceae bacterium]
MPHTILFVDDEPEMRDLAVETLAHRGFHVEVAGSAEEAMALVQKRPPDVIVTDINLAGVTGLEFCRRVNASLPDIPVIVVTAFGSTEAAVGAIRAGAYDFITKPMDIDELSRTLSRAIQLRDLGVEVKRLREQVQGVRGGGEIAHDSAVMRAVVELIGRVADSEATILVTGESGTGKELAARALHAGSRRAKRAFVAVNCAALTSTLLESELFGHVRGAFTDARNTKTGLLVAADGGTLFLDEIGEMSPSTQVKLLRALQERKVRPVGGEQEIAFDARIIAATNRDLERDVAEGRFREDLYYRINVVRIHLPPLRVRGNDILLIAQQFVGRFAKQTGKAVRGITSEAAEKLLAYEWPGNVRELQNCIERAVVLTEVDQLMVQDLPEKVRDYRATELVVPLDDASKLLSLDDMTQAYIVRVLRSLNGNKNKAAEVLGLDRRTLYRRLRGYGEIQPAGEDLDDAVAEPASAEKRLSAS